MAEYEGANEGSEVVKIFSQATYAFGEGCLRVVARPRDTSYNYHARGRDESNLTLNLKYLEENLDSISLVVAKVQDGDKRVIIPMETYLQ